MRRHHAVREDVPGVALRGEADEPEKRTVARSNPGTGAGTTRSCANTWYVPGA